MHNDQLAGQEEVVGKLPHNTAKTATPVSQPLAGADRDSEGRPLPADLEPDRDHAGGPVTWVANHWLAITGSLALVVFLKWAQEVLVPIALAVLLTYALTPVVEWLRRVLRLPNAVGAAITIAAVLGAMTVGVMALRPQAVAIIDIVPSAAHKIIDIVEGHGRGRPSTVATIQQAATEIEKAANSTPGGSSAVAPKPAAEVGDLKIRSYVWTGTMSLVTAAGQFVVVVALVYFLLIAGDSFRRTLLQISEGTLSSKKITVQMLDEIHTQIQRYLLVQLVTSAALGVLCWAIFSWVGLDNPATWGVVGGVLHLIPYAGPAAFVGLIAIVSFAQFDTLHPVLVLVGAILSATGVIGLLIVPWLTHRVGTLNAVAVFLALLIWGWLWGIWGLLLGVPLTMAVKALCDRIENLSAFGAFLGHGRPTAA
jgi:predicted PurR-regulated permease PerM